MTTIYGLDFTSAPRPSKPMFLAQCHLENNILHVIGCWEIADWESFDKWLAADDEWIAGLDFPFGQPRKFLQNIGWEMDWATYVRRISHMTMDEWLATLRAYRDAHPTGDKHHLRVTDRQTGAISPMMVYGVPVGRMFFQGAPRLVNAGVSIIPNHPTSSRKIVLETYPKLIVEWAGAGSYKSDTKRKQTANQYNARQQIVDAICTPEFQKTYGFRLDISDELVEQCIQDPKADKLDSILCAIQAAWASRQPDYGVPPDCDTLEGWIVNTNING